MFYGFNFLIILLLFSYFNPTTWSGIEKKHITIVTNCMVLLLLESNMYKNGIWDKKICMLDNNYMNIDFNILFQC